MKTKAKKQKKLVPELRFPGFFGEWENLGFYETADSILDFRGRTPLKLGMEWGGSISSLSALNVKKGYIDFELDPHMGSEELYKKWMTKGDLSKGDILLTMEAPLGNVALVPDNKKYILSQRVLALKTINSVNSWFLYHLMIDGRFQSKINQLSTGSTAKGINQRSLKKVKVILPKLVEQKKIASFLSIVDEKIGKMEKKKLALVEYKKGVMQKIFSRNLPAGRQVRFKDDGGKSFPDWEEKKLGEISDINPKAKKLPDHFVYIDLESVVDGKLIKENRIDLIGSPSRAQRLLEKKDILFQLVRPYQKNNYFFDRDGEYIASTGYAQIRFDGNQRFLYQYLHNQEFVNLVLSRCTGTSYPAINSSDLSRINVWVPSLNEQKKIAEFLTVIDEKIKVVDGEIESAKEWKRGLLQKMFV